MSFITEDKWYNHKVGHSVGHSVGNRTNIKV